MPLLAMCFRHKKYLPYAFRNNSNAWTIYALFMEFLTCLYRRMEAKNQRKLLFLDQYVPPLP
jgi:hypothetical protein